MSFKGPLDGIFYSDHVLEIYIRKAQADKIKYGADADPNERIKVEQLTLALRMPIEYVPDPRTVIEDEADRQRGEREKIERLKRDEEERLIRVAEKLARKEERQKRREEALAAKERGELDDGEMSGDESEKGSQEKRGSASSRRDTES